jgi:hypothetical protein
VVVRGAAMVAAGKLAEIVARRLTRRMLTRAPNSARLPARRSNMELKPGVIVEEEHFLSETLLLRRTRVRR